MGRDIAGKRFRTGKQSGNAYPQFIQNINPKGEEEDDRTRRLPAINTNVLIQKEKRKEHKTLAGNRY